MKKVCVLLYHKNALILFQQEWIKKCINSIKQQTFQDFDVLELNYGQTGKQLYDGSIFEHKMLNNHVEAMNYLINIAKEYYDYIFNVNIDDFYSITRIEEQLKYLKDHDMVASNHIVFKEKNGKEIEICKIDHSKSDIKQFLNKNYNIIAHPVVAWKSSFFDNLDYKQEIPQEDIKLWQRALKQNKTIFIVPKYLLYYRIHDNQITQLKIQNNVTIEEQCLMDFINIFEKSETFITWSDIVNIFKQWWEHFHSEKKQAMDYELRRVIDKTFGDPIQYRGWFIQIRKEYRWN